MEQGSRLILVVDDEPSIRELACEILQLFGYRTIDAKGSQEALALAKRTAESIGVLVTDVSLPDMDGLQLFDALSASRPSLRAVFISGQAVEDAVPDLDTRERVVFLQKPFTADMLATAVRNVLEL